MRELSWGKLLSKKRQRISTTEDNVRNEFDKDYDRIISSSSVRRLQDKTQVFPLQENDVVRTRLTHSLEVSAIARSLGLSVGDGLENQHIIDIKEKYEIASLMAVVGLVHDLGNPPFGHYGECIIRQWFKEQFDRDEARKNKIFNDMRSEEKADFLLFEGNAQTIRILSKLQFLNDRYGINFTYGTLAALIKYPWDSVYAKDREKGKFGYFNSENQLIDDIYRETGTGKSRYKNPLALLLEAADDITYLLADIEDGVKKGLVEWEKEYDKIKNKHKNFAELFSRIEDKVKDNDIPDYDCTFVHNFKVIVQGYLIKEAVKVFFEKYDEIMSGSIEVDLLDDGKYSDLKNDLQAITRNNCFNSKEVLKLELAGESAVRGLLDTFIPAIVPLKEEPKFKTHEGKLYSLISSNFKHVIMLDESGKKKNFNQLTTYEKIQLVVDYISGMTDSYAVNLYEELAGIRLPKG